MHAAQLKGIWQCELCIRQKITIIILIIIIIIIIIIIVIIIIICKSAWTECFLHTLQRA